MCIQLQSLLQALQDSRELRIKDQQLQDSQRQIKELTHQVEEKNQQLQTVTQDLLQCEQTIGDLRAANDRLKQELQQAVKDKQAGQRKLQELNQQRYMTWRDGPKVPEKICRGSVASESDSNMAYFNGYHSTRIYSYNSDTREWRWVPPYTPHKYFTLVIVKHILTMVGGELRSGEATDSLLSLMGDKQWLPDLPAMPTKRYLTAVVCSGFSLIVAGGYDGRNRLTTVEVLDTGTRQWSIASSLTHPFHIATISICGVRVFILGGEDQTVLSCFLPELLQSYQPQPPAGKPPANQSTIWQRVADAPHCWSSCATLCGQLVAVGGCDEGDRDTRAIAVYKDRTNSWEAMRDMPTARYRALVAILNGKMMVVGGLVGGWGRGGVDETDVVEILC